MTLLVGVVEGETPSRGVLPPRPDMGYVFIDPSSEPPPEAFDVDALLIWNPRSGVLRENWKRFGRLRWVHTGTAGVERVLFPELVASDVVLTNSRYVFDEALAEYTIALMLALGKDLLTTFRYQNEHRWAPRETLNPVRQGCGDGWRRSDRATDRATRKVIGHVGAWHRPDRERWRSRLWRHRLAR